MKRTKVIPIKWVNENHDSDWDKVPNYRDCQPFNPHKQEDEEEKTTMNELKRTPLPEYTQPATVPEYQYAQQAPLPPGYQYVQPGNQYAQQYQIPPRMHDESFINLPAARFKFIRII